MILTARPGRAVKGVEPITATQLTEWLSSELLIDQGGPDRVKA